MSVLLEKEENEFLLGDPEKGKKHPNFSSWVGIDWGVDSFITSNNEKFKLKWFKDPQTFEEIVVPFSMKYGIVFVEDLSELTPQSAKAEESLRLYDDFLYKLSGEIEKLSGLVKSVPSYYTSTTCNSCRGRLSKEYIFDQLCPHCGHTQNRDHAAAKNILERGIFSIVSVYHEYQVEKICNAINGGK